ncbi:MAG TPA: hypothetical protein VIQ74_16375 [Gemmatimonadaceae bacterium]|jgi:hypothetical protein
MMQNAPVAQPQSSSDLATQIRAQVRQQVEEARQAAREAARQASEQSQSGSPVILVPPTPPQPMDTIPPQVVDITVFFFITIAVILIGLPIARAIGRRIDHKPYKQKIDPAMAEQLQRIESTVESMSIEIERISEAQRYMARLQTENREPVPLPRRSEP